MTTNASLKVLLVGCGKIARKHVDAISAVDGLSLAGVCDREESRAKALGEACSVPHYADLETAMARSGATVVSILTPSGTHAKLGLTVARSGRHVVVEKPMALKLSDADELIRGCEAAKVALFVVKQNRYNPPVQAAHAALDRGRFGKLVLVTVRVRWCRPQSYYDADGWRGTWGMDGGVLANQASHHIDLLQWFGGPVETVFARGARHLARIEAEDTALAILRFESGALGVIEATTACRPKDLEGSVSILGEKGSVVLGGFAANQIDHWAFDPALPEDADIFRNQKSTQSNPSSGFGGHRSFYADLVSALTRRQTPLVDGLEGKKSLGLIHALYESIETGQEVSLTRPHGGCRLDGGH
ncbi:Gfo/Idh/MocA family oxidoreductase [bacterium]|nr:Gfo/Idh/MocA family oxidoreductase [bacterium]